MATQMIPRDLFGNVETDPIFDSDLDLEVTPPIVPAMPEKRKLADATDEQPAKRKLVDATDEEKMWWETEMGQQPLTDVARAAVRDRESLWLNKLSDERLANLEIRKGESNGQPTLLLYESAAAKDPGLSLHDLLGVIKNPRLDGLGCRPEKAGDFQRKFKMVLVPFYTPANQALHERLGGERAQWSRNLLGQLPGTREMCADEWTKRVHALITRVAELTWDFKAEDGTAVHQRLVLEKRLQGKQYDKQMKEQKWAETRQDFIEDFVATASERQWEPTTGDLFLKAPVFVESKYQGTGKHKDSARFVFENAGKGRSDISPEQQVILHESICGGPSPRYYLKPIKFFSEGREAPYGEGTGRDTVNLCDPPVHENDCVVVSVSVTLVVRDGTAEIIFKLRGGTVHIWRRGPPTTGVAVFAP